MRVALLSDIHGNYSAFKSVMQEIPSDITEIWALGDFVGYYYETNRVLNTLQESPYKVRAIRGNHEVMLSTASTSTEERDHYKKKYGSSVDIALKTLTPQQLATLVTLPDTLAINDDILLSHGSPWNYDEYVYPDVKQEVLENFLKFKQRIFFIGHTHYPMDITFKDKRIINPGSVGQQRNGEPGAHWGIFDLETEQYESRLTEYDILGVVKQVQQIDPNNEYLLKILKRGL